MAHTAVTAPAFTVLDLPADERNLIGLARVSTDAQDARLQHDALTGGPGAAGSTRRRSAPGRPPLSARAWTTCAPVTPWSCGSSTGSVGRSVREVLAIADDLHARGVGVKILTGKLSGSYSPHGEGKFFFTMIEPRIRRPVD